MSSRGVICEEPPQRCELCGIIDECRPYGPNHEEVCFKCAMQDEETTITRMIEYLFGIDIERE